jgi:predicted PurR-regulated permease PerM
VLVSSITLLFWLAAISAVVFWIAPFWCKDKRCETKFNVLAFICSLSALVLAFGINDIFDSYPKKAIGIYQNQTSKVFTVQYEQSYWTPLGVKTNVVFGDCYASYEDALKELESQGKPTPKPDEWVPVVEGTKGK